jgi:hypothetical protein
MIMNHQDPDSLEISAIRGEINHFSNVFIGSIFQHKTCRLLLRTNMLFLCWHTMLITKTKARKRTNDFEAFRCIKK